MFVNAMPPLLIVFFLVDLTLAIYAWSRRKHMPGASILAGYMLGAALASLGYGMELLSRNLEWKLVWVGLRYLGNTGLVTPIYLLLTLWFIGWEGWLKPRRALLLFILPVISLLGFFTNPLHHWHYATLGLDSSGSLVMLVKTNGPLYNFMIAYTLAYFFAGGLLALWAVFALPRSYLRQAVAILLAGLIPLSASLAYLAGWRPLTGLNLTPIAYIFSSFLFGWAVFRQQLFSVSPVTLDLLFEKMPGGVIVLDAQRRVVAANPAAQELLGLPASQLIGRAQTQACANWPALLRVLSAPFPAAHEEIAHWNSPRFFAVSVTLSPSGSRRADCIVMLSDVTHRRAVETSRGEQQRALAALAEREKLARELHDGVGQLTGFVSVQSQTARQYLLNGQPDLADAALAGLQEAAREAHADLRGYILDLRENRPAEPAGQNDFYTDLARYAARFQELYGLEVRLDLPPQPERPALRPDVALQLLRILQEALTNVRKHSGAPAARVTLQPAGRELLVMVEDNGAGFDPADTTAAGFGRGIMAERAAQIGARLEITSAPGAGTRARVWLPLDTPLPEVSPRLSHTRVLLVDDQALFRSGLRNLLAARGVPVVGEAAGGPQALELARQLRPDVILMDLNMPEMDGLEATRLLCQEIPGARVVLLTVSEDPDALMQALRAGAAGYLLKTLQAGELFAMLEALGRGEKPLAPALAGQALQALAGGGPAQEDGLNERQMQILRLAAQNLTNAQIAQRLSLSEAAVKYHFRQIFDRLQVENRAQALAQAARRGWIDRRR